MSVVVPLLLVVEPLLLDEELDVDVSPLEELDDVSVPLLLDELFFLPESTTPSSSSAAPLFGTSSNGIKKVQPATRMIVAAVPIDRASAGRICRQA